jgi:hypothetical protein
MKTSGFMISDEQYGTVRPTTGHAEIEKEIEAL